MFAIIKKKFFLDNREVSEVAFDRDGMDALVFATREDAQIWIDKANRETYYKQEREYCRPEYKIRKISTLGAKYREQLEFGGVYVP